MYPALLALTVILLGTPGRRADLPGVQRQRLRVSETAGNRRFGYPVHAELKLTRHATEKDRFRLIDGNKPVPAQFRRAAERGAVFLDFAVDYAPHETRTYTVEWGPSVPEGPTMPGLPRFVANQDGYTFAYPHGVQFVLPRHPAQLLRSVRTTKSEFLRPDGRGLWFQCQDHKHYCASGTGADAAAVAPRVVREGPYAVALRWETTEVLPGNHRVASVIDLEFPRTKSWAQVTWTLADPHGSVDGLGADILLETAGEPTLVDFGAGSYVYVALHKGQVATMQAGSLTKGCTATWATLVGPRDALRPYVVAAHGAINPAEGWAHVMDRTRCTAVAVEGFGRAGQQGEIIIDAGGRLQLERRYSVTGTPADRGTKRLRFWLHFVDMPVHIGAATSPQAMLAPLQVESLPNGTHKPN